MSKQLLSHPMLTLIFTYLYGSVSKPCTPGEHQNSWDFMDVHPPKNGINRY